MVSQIPSSAVALSPDWVMLGIPMSNGSVRLIASRELTRAELESVLEEETWDPTEWGAPLERVRASYKITLSAELKTYVIVAAPDYNTAFSRLFTAWSPEPQPKPYRPKLEELKSLPPS